MSDVIRDSHKMKRTIAAEFAKKAGPALVAGMLIAGSALDDMIERNMATDDSFDKVRNYLINKGCDIRAYDRGEDVFCDIE